MPEPKVAIIIYSMYGHIVKSRLSKLFERPSDHDLSQWPKLRKKESKPKVARQRFTSECTSLKPPDRSLKAIFRVAETLSDEILAKMYAAPKPQYPIFEPKKLPEFDAYLLGVPTRYGNMPAQWKVRPIF